MAKKVVPAKKVVAPKAAKAVVKATAAQKIVIKKDPTALYGDWVKPANKVGLYLDTWVPTELDKIKPNTVIYADCWIPVAALVKKGKKPGIYADTWLPEGSFKFKQKRSK